MIKNHARKLAGFGEEAINEFALLRCSLDLFHIQSAVDAPNGQKMEIIGNGSHQAERMDAIIRQARLILELNGEDITSRLNRLKELVAWGKIGE